MPTVPQYEPSVAPNALPGVRQESAATPAALGGAYDNLAAAGRGVELAGRDVSEITAHLQARDDEKRVFEVSTTRKEEWIKFDAQMRQQRAGANADGVSADVKQWWDDAAKQDFSALTNDRQRELYKKHIAPSALQGFNSAAQFEANQRQVAFTQAARADVVAAVNFAAANPTPENIAVQKDVIRRTNSARAIREGWSEGKDGKPGVLDVVNGEDITRLHAEVIKGLVASNKDAAAAYFEKYREEIDGSQRDQLGESARKATAESRGRTTAGEIFSTLGPDAGIDKMAEEARKRFPNDTYALAATIADLKDRVSMYEHAETTRTDNLAATINRAAINGATLSQIRSMPEFNALMTESPRGAKTAQGILDHQEQVMATRASRAASNEARLDAAESRAQRRMQRDGQETYLTLLGDPDKLAAMTPAQVVNLRTSVGDANAAVLVNRHAALTKSAEALAAAKLDQTTFKSMAAQAGLNPDKKNKSEAEIDRLVILQDAVNNRLLVAQRAAGKPLSVEDKLRISKEAFDDTVRSPGFLGITAFGTDVPISALTRDELKNAVVIVDSPKIRGNVKLTEIHPQFVEEAEATLTRNGIPITQKRVAEMWLLNRGTWKAKK